MEPSIANIFLESARKQFHRYKDLGEKAMAQVTDEQLFHAPEAESNSIAIIVKHLWGNMRSRWTDLFTTDGEKPWRMRDAEFENDWTTREEVLQKWEEGWSYLFQALDQLQPEDLTRIILIRNEPQTVLDAINRQLAHYPYHVGQMVYAAKIYAAGSWSSLSIPRNQSDAYNAKMFGEKE